MKNVIWILFNCTVLLNLITTSNCNKNEENLNVYLKPFNSSIQETSNDQVIDTEQEQTNGDNDEFEIEENIDEASSDIVESQVPFPTDKPSEIDSEVPIRKPRRKRRRRRKRPRTSTYTYEEDENHPVRYLQQDIQEPDYAEGYVRRRPIKRRRRPMHRRPLVEGVAEEENILPRRKLIRRPAVLGNQTSYENIKQWEPVTSTENGKWKPVKTTSETTNTISTTTPKSTTIFMTTTNTTPKMTTIRSTFSTSKFVEDNNYSNHKNNESPKISNSSRADIVVLHKRLKNSNLPPTSAVIRRRLKPQNMNSEEPTTPNPKMIVIKEDLPLSLLPPGYKITESSSSNEFKNSTEDYQFNDEALTKMMKEQPNNKSDEFKFKSDSIPKVKDEILSLLKTKTGSSLLSNVLKLRNMSLEELLQHRERGSSQRHQELIDTKEEQTEILSSDEPIVTDNTKNFTNYLIETKRLAQKNKDLFKPEEFKDNNKNLKNQTTIQSMNLNEGKQDEREKNESHEQISKLKQEIKIDVIQSKTPIQILKEEKYDPEVTFKPIKPTEHSSIADVEKKYEQEDMDKIKLNTIFEDKKVISFPTTTTYTTTDTDNQENEATSFVSKTPRTRIVLETSEREPRLFDSLPDFTIKTTQRSLIAPTIPSQVLFIQDTNHLDKYLISEEKSKEIDEDNNLVYRRLGMRKLPVAVKSAIIASAAILAIAILGFFVLLISCRVRQKKRILRKKSVFCPHAPHKDSDLRSSARSTSPVMDKHCQDPYYDGYGGRIDTHTTAANRQYYLWRTLRKTFRYD